MKILLKRSFLFGALIFFQLVFLLLAVYSLNVRAAYLFSAIQAANIVVVIFLINNRDNPTYKLSWIVIILAFPLFGIVIYLIAGNHHLPRKMKNRLKVSEEFNRELRYQDPKVLEELRRAEGSYARQSQYILNSDNKPVYQGTGARLLTPGETMYAILLEELRKARRFIFIEYFIIAEGSMWETILSILKEKAKQGVEVKIIYDDMGSIDRISSGLKRELKSAGIEACAFNPLLPVLNKFMNYRDHRKITVIDGNTGITGGINIGDEYINKKKIHGYWKDTSILLEGEAVWSFTIMFLDMWQFITGEKLSYSRYRPSRAAESDGFVQPFQDNPVDSLNIAESVYMQIINSARRYVYITTPYLIIDHEMSSALCRAAESGVDVRIITPGVPDKWYVHMVTRSNYRRLLESGIKIYEYLPGFIHSKTCVCDDEIGLVGTINMDYRSFYLQFENAVWLFRCSVLRDIKEDFLFSLKHSKMMDLGELNKRRRITKAAELLMRIFAPLM